MSKTETIKWIVVPNGVTPNNGNPDLLVSVFAGIELAGGVNGTLSDFPDLENWPQTLTAGGFHFQFTFIDTNNNTVLYTQGVPEELLSSTLWGNLFTASTRYGPRALEAAPNPKIPIVSYPAGQVGSFI